MTKQQIRSQIKTLEKFRAKLDKVNIEFWQYRRAQEDSCALSSVNCSIEMGLEDLTEAIQDLKSQLGII